MSDGGENLVLSLTTVTLIALPESCPIHAKMLVNDC